MRYRLAFSVLVTAVLFATVGTWEPERTSAQIITPSTFLPQKVAFYYGIPSDVNGSSGSVSDAIDVFSAYDIVVFGNGLQFPQVSDPIATGEHLSGCNQNRHSDHTKTDLIIGSLEDRGIDVYGYIFIGGANTGRLCDLDGDGTPEQSIPLLLNEPAVDPSDTMMVSSGIFDRIDDWAAMGVTGIFVDEAGYDFRISRQRQNQIVDYIHNTSRPDGERLRAFVNGFDPDDVFSSEVVNTSPSAPAVPVTITHDSSAGVSTVTHPNHGFVTGDQIEISNAVETGTSNSVSSYNGIHTVTVVSTTAYEFALSGNLPAADANAQLLMNPDGLPTRLGPDDIYLLESFQIIGGEFADSGFWRNRSEKAHRYKAQFGTHIATLTGDPLAGGVLCPFDETQMPPWSDYCQAKFDYGWWSTLIYGFDAMGWGELDFSAGDQRLPHHLRPDERQPTDPGYVNASTIGTSFTSASVAHDLTQHRRLTTGGMIEVDSLFVVNGSFESPDFTDPHPNSQMIPPREFMPVASNAPGFAWTVESVGGVPDSVLLESTPTGFNTWSAADGSQHARLDPSDSLRIYQDLPTTSGTTYQLTYSWSPQPDHAENRLEVRWDGNVIDSQQASRGRISPANLDPIVSFVHAGYGRYHEAGVRGAG